MSCAVPKLTLLTADQRRAVHGASLRILSEVGVRVDSDPAARLLTKAGARDVGGGRLLVPSELVDWAIGVAPHRIDVFDRLGHPAFVLGEGNPARFGVGVTNLYYQRPEDDDVVPFLREHLAMSVRLAHALDGFDVVSTIGCPRDVPDDTRDLVAAAEMAANTTKPLVVLVAGDSQFTPVLDMLARLADRPFFLPYVNPVTPLVLNSGTVDKMVTAIRRGLPLIFSSYGMSGATTPMDPAGTLALLNAELLAGLTLSQLLREGAPVILGSMAAELDMTGAGSVYTPRSFLLNLACAEMMAHYGIPHSGTSGSGIGWSADLPAAAHLALNHFTSCLGGAGLVPFVGGNFDSMAFSPLLAVYADWLIRMAREFGKGMDLGDASFEEIALAGPGGDFLTAPSTLANLRQPDPIWPATSLEKWRELGQPAAIDLLRQRTVDLIEHAPPPGDRHDVLARCGVG